MSLTESLYNLVFTSTVKAAVESVQNYLA